MEDPHFDAMRQEPADDARQSAAITRLLADADDAVSARRASYGDPEPFFRALALRWSLALGTRVTPRQAALLLLDMKVQRLAHDPCHRDSLVDAAGYAAIIDGLPK